ncbi:hypothetical protein SAMN04488066_1284 [Halorubrum aquaticum]|uniref:Uncharacterized protein n=2 Tax=Halorubrum aquaticum TaxID=387340 RepID=A0A1I3CS99_9EURY|nr:hypothetical protein [Halorubrum aquaticum]SFH77121.1 hypothetical protein SAMN04488066_1284 [Halorubrum aquaticum]
MDRPPTPSRRQLLAGHAGGLTLAFLAGCVDRDPTDPGVGGSGSPEGNGSEPPESEELDLREANVVDVAFETAADGYAFDVTLHHDDEGEDGYANWWQIERIDGTRLGRRDLLHAHTQQPFTRSETVSIPDDAGCVVVRGHDQTHGYGGLAALVELDSGARRFVDQGPEPRSFGEDDCP